MDELKTNKLVRLFVNADLPKRIIPLYCVRCDSKLTKDKIVRRHLGHVLVEWRPQQPVPKNVVEKLIAKRKE